MLIGERPKRAAEKGNRRPHCQIRRHSRSDHCFGKAEFLPDFVTLHLIEAFPTNCSVYLSNLTRGPPIYRRGAGVLLMIDEFDSRALSAPLGPLIHDRLITVFGACAISLKLRIRRSRTRPAHLLKAIDTRLVAGVAFA